MNNRVGKVIFESDCKICNFNNEVAVPKNKADELYPRYCTECGSKTYYSKKPCSLYVVSEPQ